MCSLQDGYKDFLWVKCSRNGIASDAVIGVQSLGFCAFRKGQRSVGESSVHSESDCSVFQFSTSTPCDLFVLPLVS